MATAVFEPLTAAGCVQGWCFCIASGFIDQGLGKVLPCFFGNTDHTFFCNLLFTDVSFLYT